VKANSGVPLLAGMLVIGLTMPLLLAACGGAGRVPAVASPTPSPIATAEPTAPPAPTITPPPTATPVPTETATPAPSSTATITATPPSTATPEPTEILKPTRTPAPTGTPTPLPDFSRLGPTLQDLPAGFEKISVDEAGYSESTLRSNADVQHTLAFRIVTPEHVQTVVVFYATLAARLGESAKNPALTQAVAKATLLGLVDGYTRDEENIKVETLQVPSGLGDFAEGKTFDMPIHEPGMEAFHLREELVVVQRGATTLIVIVESAAGPGFTPVITAPQLAKMLDDQLIRVTQ
jgi:hypothetical protein